MLACSSVAGASSITPPPSQNTRPHDLAITDMLPTLAISSPFSVHQATQSPATSRPSRPRLKLNISDVSQPTTWTKGGATSLRLDTLSAVSPTARNTFSNGQGPSLPTTPSQSSQPSSRPQRPRLAIDSSVTPNVSESNSPYPASATRTPSSASVLSAISSDSSDSSSSTDSTPTIVLYKPNYNLRSCLRNSPLPPAAMSAATKRPMFPAQKRVSFRSPLDEEIHTTKYTVAHSELELSSEASTVSLSPDTNPGPSEPDPRTAPNNPSAPGTSNLTRAVSDKATRPKSAKPRLHRLSRSPKTGDKRSSDSEDSDSDQCPETPVAGRRKKQREWVWTLGPINGHNVGPASSDDETDHSSDRGSLASS